MKVTDFDFHLPESLIAKRPATPRDNCRLLVLRRDGSLEHRRFFHLPEYLSKGDLLLLNNTKVFPAILTGKKQTGGRIEMLLIRETEPDVWEVLTRERYTGKIQLSEELSGEMYHGKTIRFKMNPPGCHPERDSGSKEMLKQVQHDTGLERHSGNKLTRCSSHQSLMEMFWKVGLMPLPPYIKRKPQEMDKEWYQTVYASREGSIAAPTAGLHFTRELLSALEEKGVLVRFLTLHVGIGTFKPIRVEDPEEHSMDAELFEIDGDLLRTISEVKGYGGKLVSVGTTTTRAIEGFFSGRFKDCNELSSELGVESSERKQMHPAPNSKLRTLNCRNGSFRGKTDIFIYPGYQFCAVDSLITNFHLPGSTPLMLTAALSGMRNLLDAYRCAVSMEYRFFSYGDAMLIL